MQRAEQMTFTGGWLRRLITNFHKMARLVCQDATHKCEGITMLATFCRSQAKQVKGMKCSRWHFMQSKPIKCDARGEVSAIRVAGVFWGDELTDLKNAWLRREWCAWVTVQQMCRDVTCVHLTCFRDDESPTGWSKKILVLHPLPHICKSSLPFHLSLLLSIFLFPSFFFPISIQSPSQFFLWLAPFP